MPDRRRRALLAAGAAGGVLTLPWLNACTPAAREIPGGWLDDAGIARGHALRDGRWPRADAAGARRVQVAVLGAGVAGLATARALRRAGLEDLRVFELEDAAGGNARGHELGGMRCPLGAHYLPLPTPEAREVAELLHELGLARHELGRTVWDERHLVHAPQERVFVPAPQIDARGAGRWHEGLLTLDGEDGAVTQAQAQRFAGEVDAARRAFGFSMPTLRSPWNAGLAALDAQTFADWLDARGFDDARLRAYLDYCCRDDYGAGAAQVSAWAGLHYFASRRGADEDGSEEPVLTWPEGNAWLTGRLAAGLGERLQTGCVVTRIAPARHEVAIDLWHAGRDAPERWLARQVVVALPLFIAAWLIDAPPAALAALAPRLVYAPWLVSNLLLSAPLADRPGPPPAWDNVIHGSPALGYVDAMHQSLRSVPGPTVLTHYWALGGDSPEALRAQRTRLLSEPWRVWRDAVLADLAVAHPDLAEKTERIELMRYGHAMLVPRPGLRGDPALAALAAPQGRLHFAHADLSASSCFEEAYTRGTLAAQAASGAAG